MTQRTIPNHIYLEMRHRAKAVPQEFGSQEFWKAVSRNEFVILWDSWVLPETVEKYRDMVDKELVFQPKCVYV